MTSHVAAAAEPVIRVTGLEKRYGATRAVDRVTFEVQPGTIVGLLGPNGAGNTTPVEVLGGYQRSSWTMSARALRPPAWFGRVRSSGWAG